MNILLNLLDLFSGSKTYAIGVALIVLGGVQLTHGQVLSAAASIAAGLGLITGRRAVDR